MDLSTLGAAFEWAGIQPSGAMSGYTKLQWPNGRFAERRGEGDLTFVPPDGVIVAGRQLPPDADQRDVARVRPWGPFNPDPRLIGEVPVAGELTWRLDPEWIDLAPSWMATRDTYVSFEGRTAYGERSTIPFHVTSTDWQESDRVLAGIMTAFGSPTTAVAVGGYGQFDGTMRLASAGRASTGDSVASACAAGTSCGARPTGDLVIENGYVTLTNARVTSGESVVETEGRFALGYPRRDGGEEIDARVRLTNRPLADLRHAFLLDDYPIEGKVSGEFHLYGKYQTPFGFGRMQIDEGVAYDEPFETATAALRFEGQGVRLDGIEARKSEGRMTGAAYVGWEGTYSFNFSGRGVPVESVYAMTFPQAPLTGQLDFTAAGSGVFESPQYNVRMSVSDLFVKDEGIGEVTARLTIRDNTLGIEMDAASPRLIVSGTGRISMTDEYDAELTFRFTDTSLDPYVRTFRPELSPFTTAVASGTLRVTGELDQPSASPRGRACRRSSRCGCSTTSCATTGRCAWCTSRKWCAWTSSGWSATARGSTWAERSTSAPQQIAIRSTGDANLGILQGFLRDLRSSGQADLVADITGPLANPVFSGRASIAGGRIRHFSLPHALEAVNGRVTFDARGVRLDEVTARLGGGLVRFGGRISLAGYRPSEFNLTATGEDMRLRYPEGFRSVIDADLSLRGAFEAPVLGGTVTVKSSVWSRRVEASGNFLEFVGRATPVGPGAAPSSFPLRFDVRLIAPSTLRIDNNLARIVSSADLVLRGTYDKPRGVRPRRNRARRGDLRRQALRRHARHDRLQQPEPDRAVLRCRSRDAPARAGAELHRDAQRRRHLHAVSVGAQLRPAAADGGRAGDAAQRHRADRPGAGGAAAT